MDKFKIIKSIMYLVLMLSIQNCSQQGKFQTEETSSNSSSSVLDENVRLSQKDCRFIGGTAIATVLTDILGIASGDIAMLNEEGSPLKSNNCKSFNHVNSGRDCFYLNEYSNELSTQVCNASTFRLVSQIYINACTESLNDESNKTRLFPNGSQDTSTIHTAFTGRVPRSDESQILKDLTTQFESEQEKMTAVCAAIGSSLASINSF